MALNKKVPGGNAYDKYRTKNPLVRFLMRRFLRTLDSLIATIDTAHTVLEVGCGEGYLLNHVRDFRAFTRQEGIDISEEIVKEARRLHPSLTFNVGSVYALDYRDGEFDLVLACEVLEHLKDYDAALSELKRVTDNYCIVSVPVEPMWKILNFARGWYISSLGNSPGHIQHWNKQEFINLLERYFTVEKVRYPLPWQMAFCKK